MCTCFLYNARYEKGNAKHRNSPGDCFGGRVRAAERRSEAGESRRLRHKKAGALLCTCFLYNARYEKGNAKHRNSPGDCFGGRVRAAERRSEAGESRRLRQIGASNI